MVNSTMSSKRIAIIGAGISGLVSIKSCLDEGLTPVCFEKSDRVAGLWNYSDAPRKDGGGALYECLVTNSSKEMMCFSDFPFTKDYPPYLTPKLALKYYQDYADHFGLHKYITLNAEISKVEQTGDFNGTGRWVLHIRENGQPERTETFDAVMVCTGMYSSPFFPKCEGLDEFQGTKLHSNEFRRGRDYEGKTVLVVGDSHSAGDCAVDSSRHAKQVYLSMRNGAWVVLRMGFGATPVDHLVNKRFNHMIPNGIRQFIVERIIQSKIDHAKLGLKSTRRMFSGSVMVNDDIHNRIFCGSLKCKPEIQRFTPNGVKFVDGSEINDLDVVIFATGYNLDFPFIDASILADNFADLELYYHVFPPRLQKSTMAVIGAMATVGAHGPVFELQARWATRVFKGVAELPEQETMLEDIGRRKDKLYKTFGKHRILFPPVPYLEELADQIGARPKFWNILPSDPKLAFRLVFGPCYPASYRLVGPGASWDKARETIMKAPENMLYPTQTVMPKSAVKSNKGISFSFLLKLLIVIILPLLLGLRHSQSP